MSKDHSELPESRPSRLPAKWADPTSRMPVTIGIGLVAVGMMLLWLAWAVSAGTTDLHQQVSAAVGIGGTGLGVTHIGTALTTAAVVRRDAALRDIAIDRLARQISPAGAAE